MAEPTTKSKALLGAYKRGVAARKAKQAISTCPYQVAPFGCHRRNGGTWGAVFRSYWMQGFWDEHHTETTEMGQRHVTSL